MNSTPETRSWLIRRVHLATMADATGWGECRDAAVAVQEGRIAWVGPAAQVPAPHRALPEFDGERRWLTPGLIDCHTHLVWAGSRAAEIELRWQGARYEDIARSGGGIVSTVRATRQATLDELITAATPRLQTLMAEGVTTVEIKSGYGLELAAERRMLQAARKLGEREGVTVRTTFLGAHALPSEFQGRADDYIDLVCGEMLPTLHREGWVDAVDAFCEGIGFTPEQTRRVFQAAAQCGLPVKLHADQLSDLGGAQLAAEHRALSADHLECTNETSVRAMAAAGTVAVLLPGAFYCLRETRLPPVQVLREHGVPMALATDCNPGTSPCTSLLLMLHMGCTFFGLTPVEALAGVTRHAARALGLQDEVGRIAAGLRADLALWDIDHPRDLACQFGHRPLAACWRGGRLDLAR